MAAVVDRCPGRDCVFEIPLTKGLATLVDREDYEAQGRFKWIAQMTGNGVYAARADYSSGQRRYLLLHREILGADCGHWVDHRNGRTLDNRRGNLRLCLPSQNAANQRKQKDTKLSRFKGVAFVPQLNKSNPWVAFIGWENRRHHLGYWPDEESAARARDKAALELHGEFARLNLP